MKNTKHVQSEKEEVKTESFFKHLVLAAGVATAWLPIVSPGRIRAHLAKLINF